MHRAIEKAAKASSGQFEHKCVGRPPLFDEKECTELASQQRSKDLAKNSASGSELQTIFYEKRKEKAKRENKNEISVPKSISNGSLRKYQKIILPEKLKTVKKQNKRRLQAVSDLPNFVSAAGVFMSVFSVDLNDARYSRVCDQNWS